VADSVKMAEEANNLCKLVNDRNCPDSELFDRVRKFIDLRRNLFEMEENFDENILDNSYFSGSTGPMIEAIKQTKMVFDAIKTGRKNIPLDILPYFERFK